MSGFIRVYVINISIDISMHACSFSALYPNAMYMYTMVNASHDTSLKYLPHAFACLRDEVSIALFILQIKDRSLDLEVLHVESIGCRFHPGSSLGKHRPQVRWLGNLSCGNNVINLHVNSDIISLQAADA